MLVRIFNAIARSIVETKSAIHGSISFLSPVGVADGATGSGGAGVGAGGCGCGSGAGSDFLW